MVAKLVYNDTNVVLEVGEVLTNHSMTVDQMIDFIGVDMDRWARDKGMDDWDFEALEILVA